MEEEVRFTLPSTGYTYCFTKEEVFDLEKLRFRMHTDLKHVHFFEIQTEDDVKDHTRDQLEEVALTARDLSLWRTRRYAQLQFKQQQNYEHPQTQHYVLRKRDVDVYLNETEQLALFHLIQKLEKRKKETAGIKSEDHYVVVNCDEPYAAPVIEILKRNGHWERSKADE